MHSFTSTDKHRNYRNSITCAGIYYLKQKCKLLIILLFKKFSDLNTVKQELGIKRMRNSITQAGDYPQQLLPVQQQLQLCFLSTKWEFWKLDNCYSLDEYNIQ